MFTIELTITNPASNESRRIVRQFDPATMTQAKWAAAFTPAVKPEIDALVASADANEPQKW